MSNRKYLDYDGLEHVSEYIKERLIVVTSIPASPADGDVVLYMGTTTEDYTHGCLYSYNAADAEWIVEATGIKLKLNGEDISGQVEIYAPTQSGSRGEVLTSNGIDKEPIWSAFSGYTPTVDDDVLLFSFGVLPLL